jgi:hypothetical protein
MWAASLAFAVSVATICGMWAGTTPADRRYPAWLRKEPPRSHAASRGRALS